MVVVAGMLVTAASRWSAGNRPNILFIMADDHAWQAVSAYGESRHLIQTPNIDRLANEGNHFDLDQINCAVGWPKAMRRLSCVRPSRSAWFHNVIFQE